MKKIFFMIMVMITFCGGFVTGCKKDDSNTVEESAEINGVEYSVTKTSYNYSSNVGNLLDISVLISNYNDVEVTLSANIFSLKSIDKKTGEDVEFCEDTFIYFSPTLGPKNSDVKVISYQIGSKYKDRIFEFYVGNVKLAIVDGSNLK